MAADEAMEGFKSMELADIGEKKKKLYTRKREKGSRKSTNNFYSIGDAVHENCSHLSLSLSKDYGQNTQDHNSK